MNKPKTPIAIFNRIKIFQYNKNMRIVTLDDKMSPLKAVKDLGKVEDEMLTKEELEFILHH